MENENILLLTEEEMAGMVINPLPPSLSILTINKNLQFHFTESMPGWWHRLWYRVLLGWRWENCETR